VKATDLRPAIDHRVYNQSRLLQRREEPAAGAPFSLTECADANMRAQ
jgi:hypothetical protein